MLEFKRKKKFREWDKAVLHKKLENIFEEVTVLKEVQPEDERNRDLGITYLLRGSDGKMKIRYENELITIDEAQRLRTTNTR